MRWIQRKHLWKTQLNENSKLNMSKIYSGILEISDDNLPLGTQLLSIDNCDVIPLEGNHIKFADPRFDGSLCRPR